MQAKITFKFFISIILMLNLIAISSLAFTEKVYGSTDAKPSREKIISIKKSIEIKRSHARAKIKELKRKEKIEVGKLYKSQINLEETKNDIGKCKVRLDQAKGRLDSLESQIGSATDQQVKTADLSGDRLKQIYKGERISVLHLIFASQDLGSFLDRIYYQKRLATYDRKLLGNLRTQTKRLINIKQGVETEKITIVSTIDVMNQKKQQITAAINTSQYLINRLRTDRGTYESAERELANQSSSLAAMLERNLSQSSLRTKVTTGFARPLMGIITSPFGWRRHPIFGSRSFHTGVDIAAANRTPIRASNAGKVIYTGWYGGYGKVVIVSHGQYRSHNTSTLYAHLSGTAVRAGQTVGKSQVIGYEGMTGYSTGPHLHFEVRLNGSPTNPLNYIP